MTSREREAEYFEFKCWKGLRDRGVDHIPEYRERLTYELGIIKGMGFCGYFLIVADFLSWAREHGIPVGPGRGSAAGSLAVYALHITNLDPIRFGLLFERFMNPDRVAMPDIDIDLDEERRQEVIDYVVNKYRSDHVAQIGTFGTMKAKGAIRDTVRTLGFPIQMGDKLASLIPPPAHGKPIPLAKSYTMSPQLDEIHKSQSDEGNVLRWADKIENTIKSFGVHASGVVISPVPIWKLVPLGLGKGGVVATQFEMNAVEKAGLIKFDFLGLRTLSMMARCLKLIQEYHGVKIDLDKISIDDPAIYANLDSGDTCGIFQLEASTGMQSLLMQIHPTKLEDIAALVAMYRPGPLGSDGMKMYLDWRNGRGDPTYPFKELEPILAVTGGWIIYQEQCMKIAQVIAGYTKSMADDFRKAIGKKKPEEMMKHEKLFIAGAIKNGYDEKIASALYADMKAFGSYGFNLSHALCYGYLTYQTSWLKTHYPVEFMCACLTSDQDNTDKVIKYITECKRLGIKILPPDVNESNAGFTIVEKSDRARSHLGTIRFGLSAVKNLGDEPVSFITDIRMYGKFTGLLDFCNRVNLSKINRKKVESLVLCGAFDFTGNTRTSLLSGIDIVWDYQDEMERHASKRTTYDKRVISWAERERERAAGSKKPSLKKPEEPSVPKAVEIPDLPEMDQLELLEKEKQLIGFYISGHPLDSYSISGEDLFTVASIPEVARNRIDQGIEEDLFVRIACVLSSLEKKNTKAGELMAFGQVEDKTGQMDCVIFPKVYEKSRAAIESNTPVIVSAKVEVTSNDVESADEDTSLNIRVKLIIMGVKTLTSGKVRNAAIEISIKPEEANNFLSLVKRYPGEEQPVHIMFKTHDNSLFKTHKIVYIGGDVPAFIREVGRLQ